MKEEILQFLRDRQSAYRTVFADLSRKARTRSDAYKVLFSDAPAASFVMKDLARFCRATETTYHADDRIHARLEGRREVWLRIQQHINLTEEQLFKILE